mmetsp:Transcript_12592/g.18876  ORF Transcript_12592/g.18876 Transcript_12592/m.18876 type:complete len:554 (+) Transcript_12592:147-1808(+)|eukprot:CAMPEP_0197319596 /NCGR_PEP_ID=MMETSP0891-20130614/55543_1 /TAXON_ID=44058 ORGANISM="Aureoumbra lagunensis, Strain CCMP1510" /NCGR_SAMPLE_ID=MMETSP0891 /ASSEMBLY_ACC=CAM_ASM_000534 /LENGTH=553 /DNA_ID=CAMNT_0042810617 /DNA_START=1407 /DNA_END=3068 /DNA_ORIENTATION=+
MSSEQITHLVEELRLRREDESGINGVVKEYGSVLSELDASKAAFRALSFEVEILRRRSDQVIEREEAVEHAAKLEKRTIELQKEVATARAAQQLAVSSAKNAAIEALEARETSTKALQDCEVARAAAAANSAKYDEIERALTVAMHERDLGRRQLRESEEESKLLKRQNDELVLRLVDDKQRLVTEMNSMNEMIAKLSRENRLLSDQNNNFAPAVGASIQLQNTKNNTRWEPLLLGSVSEMSSARTPLVAHELCEIHEICFEAEEGDFLWTAGADGVSQRLDVQTSSKLSGARFLTPQSAAVLSVDVVRNLVATASSDRALRMLDAGTGRLKLQLENAHGSRIICVRISADGRCIFSGSADRCIKMWDLRSSSTSRAVRTLRTPSACHAVACNLSLDTIDSGHRDGYLRSWDLRGSKDSPSSEIEGTAPILGLVRSPKSIVALRRDATVHVYDPATFGRLVLLSHDHFQVPSSAHSVRPAFSPDASHVAVPSSLGGCVIFDLSTGLASCVLRGASAKSSLKNSGAVAPTTSVSWSRRGLLVASDKHGSLSFWH